MRRLRMWYGALGLATKQFIYLFLVTSVLFAALVWNNYRESAALFERQMLQDSQTIVERTNHLLNAYSDHIQSMLLLLQMNRDHFVLGHEEAALSVMYNYADFKGTIAKTLYFITEEGRVFSSEQVLFDIMGNPELLRMYRDVRKSNGAIAWSEPYHSPITGKTIAFMRPVFGDDKRIVGTAVVEIDLNLLHRRLEQLLVKEGQSYVVISSQHNPIDFDEDSALLTYAPSWTEKKLSGDFLRTLGGLPAGIADLPGESRTLVALKSNQNLMGWYIVALVDQRYLYRSIDQLNANYRNAALVWVLVLLVSSHLMSRYFTKPVRMLAAKMDRVREFDVASPISFHRSDEIGRLADSYNSLMARVHALIAQVKESERSKKEYELKALQSQIGPHFLYNTLACVSSLAKQHKIAEVRQTIRSLIGLLSFSFNKSSEYTTLAEELESLRMYAQIQRVKYGDAFRLDVRVDPDMLGCKVLKLMLQPLVENAIFHGIVPAERKGTVYVVGRIHGERLKLYVVDDGVGIPPDDRKALLQGRPGERSAGGFNSIGLLNVHERIRIYYGEEYGLRIASRPQAGTVVRMTLPRLPLGEAGGKI